MNTVRISHLSLSSRYHKKENIPLISVIIPTHNRKRKLIRLVKSILESSYPRNKIEIIIIDDASTDGTYEEIKKTFPDAIRSDILKIIRNKKEQYSTKCRNMGVKIARGDYVFLIDDDNVVGENTIKELLRTFEISKDVGMVCPLTLYYKEPDKIWSIGGHVPIFWRRLIIRYTNVYVRLLNKKVKNADLPHFVTDLDFCPNAFMMPRDVALETLPSDLDFPHNWSEVEWGLKVKKMGLKVVCNTKALVWHDVDPSLSRKLTTRIDKPFKIYDQMRSRAIFIKKYGTFMDKLLLLLTTPLLVYAYMFLIIVQNRKKGSISTFINNLLKGITHGLFK